jgi:hypothetical protein
MDKETLKIQVESDLNELQKDINLGVYDRTPEEYVKATNKIWQKISEFVDMMQKDLDHALVLLKQKTLFEEEQDGIAEDRAIEAKVDEAEQAK